MEFIHRLAQIWSNFTAHIEDFLTATMLAYGYRTIFFGVMLENAGLPIPGETILILGGYFAAKGHFHLSYVMAIAACGASIGDNIGFAIGRYFGREFLLRHGRWILLTPGRLAAIDRFFVKHGNKTILVARFISGLRVFAALFAGTSQMRWRTFVAYNLAGAVLWAVVISSLGYIFAPSLALLESWVGRGGSALLLVGIAGVAIAWKIEHKRRKAALAAAVEAES